jgi:hypothetical protein
MKTRIILSLFLALVFAPIISYATMYEVPDDSMLTVSVGDNAPLTTPALQKAHADGKAIVLMFGSPNNDIASEKTWMSINQIAPKFARDAAAFTIDYRGEDFGRPSAEAAELARQYGVIGAPWVFVIDKTGVVTHVYIGKAGTKELDAELSRITGRN